MCLPCPYPCSVATPVATKPWENSLSRDFGGADTLVCPGSLEHPLKAWLEQVLQPTHDGAIGDIVALCYYYIARQEACRGRPMCLPVLRRIP